MFSYAMMAKPTGASEQRRDWFVEEEVIFDELILLFISHLGKRIVFAGEFPIELIQGSDGHGLHATALSPSAMRREGDAF